MDDFCNYLMEMDGKTAADFEITGLPMAAATTSVWKSTAVRAPWSTLWMQKHPAWTKLRCVSGPVVGRAGSFTTIPIPEKIPG